MRVNEKYRYFFCYIPKVNNGFMIIV